MDATEYQPVQVMDVDQLEDIAYNGGQMPDLRSQAQCVLFLALRNLYDYAKRVQMPPEQGRREKAQILENYRTNKFMEELFLQTNERCVKTETARAAYRKSRTLENADLLLIAIDGGDYRKKEGTQYG